MITQPGKFFTATGEKPSISTKESAAFCLPPLAGSAAEPEQVKKAIGFEESTSRWDLAQAVAGFSAASMRTPEPSTTASYPVGSGDWSTSTSSAGTPAAVRVSVMVSARVLVAPEWVAYATRTVMRSLSHRAPPPARDFVTAVPVPDLSAHPGSTIDRRRLSPERARPITSSPQHRSTTEPPRGWSGHPRGGSALRHRTGRITAAPRTAPGSPREWRGAGCQGCTRRRRRRRPDRPGPPRSRPPR